MHPVLFEIGWFKINSYGLLLALSFLVGIYLSMYRAKKREIDKNLIMDLAFVIIICALIGSRLLYVVTHLDEFKGHWFDIINPIHGGGEIGIGGLTMLGGVVMVLFALVLFCKVKKLSILKVSDVMTPALALGIGITRIGCFLAGCCFGRSCDLPWGLVFPSNSPAGYTFPEQHLHPTQLYAAAYGFIIFTVIIIMDRKRRMDGFLLSLFFILYGLSRFFIDFVRYYSETELYHIFGLEITINQIISLLMCLFGFSLIILLSRREKQKP